MKDSSGAWRYQQHMLTVKAISYYSVLMCGTPLAEDCGGKMNDGCGSFLWGSSQCRMRGITAGILRRFIKTVISLFTLCFMYTL